MSLTSLHLLGFDFNTLAINSRQQISFLKEEIITAYETFFEEYLLKDIIILSTCNRIEFYGIAENRNIFYNEIEKFLFQKINKNNQKKLTEQSTEQFKKIMQQSYYFENLSVVSHLYRVVASLKSMVIGENQILGQVKNCYFDRKTNKQQQNKTLNKLFETSIALGREVRRDTNIGKGKLSIASVSIELVKKIYSTEQEITFCLIGAGEINEEVLENLKDFSSAKILLLNRSLKKAKIITKKHNFKNLKIISLEKIYQTIINADVIITSTQAGKILIEKKKLQKELKKKEQDSKTNCQLFIDLSIPLNIESSINEIPSIIHYNIDQLNIMIDKNKKKRILEINKVEKIITEEVKKFLHWQIYSFLHQKKKSLKKENLTKEYLLNKISDSFYFLEEKKYNSLMENIVIEFLKLKQV